MNPDGSGQENLTRNPYDDFDPAWAPSGNVLVFTSTRDGNPELYVGSLTLPARESPQARARTGSRRGRPTDGRSRS
jgi:Tol biopolymer transport system component